MSLRRVLGFGGRVREVGNGLCHGLTDGNGWTARKWESLRTGWACPWVGSGFRRACLWGGQRTLSRTHGRERMDDAQMGVASEWVGLSLRRVVGFGGRVREVG